MNSKTWTRIITLALFAALVIPFQLASRNTPKNTPAYDQLTGRPKIVNS